MTTTQSERFESFKLLHSRDRAFVIANPWDAGSARILASLGFEALATTSAGYAFSVGRRDSFAGLERADILGNAQAIVEATHLPVTADLEDGFGPAPRDCARTIELAIQIGLFGGSIEDATGDPDNPIFEMAQAVDRIAAACDVAVGKPFLLTARAENFLWGNPDLEDTIKRLQAFSDAGADVLYAPGLPDLASIREVCSQVDKPVNVVMGLQGGSYSVDELSKAGVKRISVGGSFARAALGEMVRAARETLDTGTFSYAERAIPDRDVAAMMSGKKRRTAD